MERIRPAGVCIFYSELDQLESVTGGGIVAQVAHCHRLISRVSIKLTRVMNSS